MCLYVAGIDSISECVAEGNFILQIKVGWPDKQHMSTANIWLFINYLFPQSVLSN